MPAGFDYIATLGSGSFGVLVKAFQKVTKRTVAIKFLKQENFSDEVKQRFHREAQILARLDHPNIQKVLGFGFLNENRPYIVSEFHEGETLEDKLAQKETLNLTEFAEIFPALLDACDFLHQNKIVHRDLKPGNIFIAIGEDGAPDITKLIDFGLAKLIEGSPLDPKLTQTGAIIGTPAYMSPEQSIGKTAESKSDIFSLACIMYECLSGTPPWHSENMLEMLSRRNSEEVPPLRKDRVPLAVQELINKMLAKDPAQRPAAAEASRELKTCIASSNYKVMQDSRTLRKENRALIFSALALIVLLAAAFALSPILHQKSKIAEESSENKKSASRRATSNCIIWLARAQLKGSQIELKEVPADKFASNYQEGVELIDKVLATKNVPSSIHYSAYCGLAYLSAVGHRDQKEWLEKAIEVAKIDGQLPPKAYSAPLMLGNYYFPKDLPEAKKYYLIVRDLKTKLAADQQHVRKAGERPTELQLFEIPDDMPGKGIQDEENMLNLHLGQILCFEGNKEGVQHLLHVLRKPISQTDFPPLALIHLKKYFRDHPGSKEERELDINLEERMRTLIDDIKSRPAIVRQSLADQLMNDTDNLWRYFKDYAGAAEAMVAACEVYPNEPEYASKWQKVYLPYLNWLSEECRKQHLPVQAKALHRLSYRR